MGAPYLPAIDSVAYLSSPILPVCCTISSLLYNLESTKQQRVQSPAAPSLNVLPNCRLNIAWEAWEPAAVYLQLIS